MIAILITILIILLVGGVTWWLWKQAPIIPEPFKAIGGWLILVVTIVLTVIQLIHLTKLIH